MMTNQTLTVHKNEDQYRYWDQPVINVTFMTMMSNKGLNTLFVGEDGRGQNITCPYYEDRENFICNYDADFFEKQIGTD